MAHTSSRLAAAATATATVLVGSLAATRPAGAAINPGASNHAAYTVAQTPDWETMSNLPMVYSMAMPGFGFRAPFRVKVGVRWDSGLYLGGSAGAVEARAELYVDTPQGRVRAPFALVAVHAVPAFNGAWLTGCQAYTEGWQQWAPVAQYGSWTCSAPTVAGAWSNYQMGAYSACVNVGGLAFADQPSSWFSTTVCPPSAQRI